MIKIQIQIILFLILTSPNLLGNDLIGKKLLCPKILWAFEFISSDKVEVIRTDINNKTNVKKYYYETDFELPYINIYLIHNNIKEKVYSIYNETYRIDVWTMTSGGITTREIIPEDFCKEVQTNDLLTYIEDLKK